MSFVSRHCKDETCRCGKAATKKVEEVIFQDDPNQMRHNLTQYVCDDHFAQIMGHHMSEHEASEHEPSQRCPKCGGRRQFFYCKGKHCYWSHRSPNHPLHSNGEAFHAVCSVCQYQAIEPIGALVDTAPSDIERLLHEFGCKLSGWPCSCRPSGVVVLDLRVVERWCSEMMLNARHERHGGNDADDN